MKKKEFTQEEISDINSGLIESSLKKPKWEEEFEDEMFDMGCYEGGFHLKRHWDENGFYDLSDYLWGYIGNNVKVKIKLRKGCIQIERI